jgi:hypothetical protein
MLPVRKDSMSKARTAHTQSLERGTVISAISCLKFGIDIFFPKSTYLHQLYKDTEAF